MMENFNIAMNLYFQTAIAYLPKVILVIFTLFFGFWMIQKIREYIFLSLKKTNTELTINHFLSTFVSFCMKGMLILSVASMLGIQTASFIAIFTALAFAVGTALSGNIGHFASGVMLMLFRPYKIGDEITVQGYNGKVQEIHIFNTSIVTYDNRKIIIPNGVITNGVITNFSHQARIQVNVSFLVANDTDFEQAKNLIADVAKTCPQSLKDVECKILLNGLSKNGLEIYARPWCHPDHVPSVHFYFQEQVRTRFVANGIQVPR